MALRNDERVVLEPWQQMPDRVETPSAASRFLTLLGRLSGGNHKMGPDYYYLSADRKTPASPDEFDIGMARTNIFTNGVRRRHVNRQLGYASLAIAVMSTVGWLSLGSVQAGLEKWHNSRLEAAANERTDALNALGAIDAQHCSAQLADINDMLSDTQGKKAEDLSGKQQALRAYASSCSAQSLIALDPAKPGQPSHYHARKFDNASFAEVSLAACSSKVADINAMTAKDGWRTSIDADDLALSSYAMTCSTGGFLVANDTSPMAAHPVYSPRKFDPEAYSLNQISAAKCEGIVAPLNAIAAKPNWRFQTNADGRTLSNFAMGCVNMGFLRDQPGTGNTDTYTTTGKQ